MSSTQATCTHRLGRGVFGICSVLLTLGLLSGCTPPPQAPLPATVDPVGGVGKSNELLVFGATWCGPCQQYKPVVAKLRERYPDLTIRQIDVDEEPSLATKYDVASIPYSVLLRNGEIIDSKLGKQAFDTADAWLAKKLSK